MLWILLALIAGLTQAGNDALSKRFFSDLTAYEMGLIRLLYALPFLMGGLFAFPWPALDKTFWLCLAFGLPLEVIAFLCYMRAIKISPLSLTIPFLGFTPAFVILTGFVILDETPNLYGILGICLIVAGAYVLNFSNVRLKWHAPLMAILREQGSRLMLLTALIYSVTATLGKLAIQHASPEFFGIIYFLFLAVLLVALFPFMPGARVSHLFKKPLPAVLGGLFLGVMALSHSFAISLVQAAYMLSVKRSSLVFGVLFGAIVFHERQIPQRLLGASIMMAGVILIGFLG